MSSHQHSLCLLRHDALRSKGRSTGGHLHSVPYQWLVVCSTCAACCPAPRHQKNWFLTCYRFADDYALLAHTEEALQRIITCFANAAGAFGLTISLKKTEVMCQKTPCGAYHPPSININGHQLNAVDTFTYLRSVISNDATATKDATKQAAPSDGYNLSTSGQTTFSALKQRSKCIELY